MYRLIFALYTRLKNIVSKLTHSKPSKESTSRTAIRSATHTPSSFSRSSGERKRDDAINNPPAHCAGTVPIPPTVGAPDESKMLFRPDGADRNCSAKTNVGYRIERGSEGNRRAGERDEGPEFSEEVV